MGYAATNILIYGVAVDEQTAKALFENEYDEETGEFKEEHTPKLIFSRPQHPHPRSTPAKYPISPYKHDNGFNSCVFDLTLRNIGTHSAAENNTFEPGYEHYFGIYVASNGYAYQDDEVSFIRNIPPEVIANFEEKVLPLMEKYNIQGEADIHIINQTW